MLWTCDTTTVFSCTNCAKQIVNSTERQRHMFRKTGRIFCTPTCGYAHRDRNKKPRDKMQIAMSCHVCGEKAERSRKLMLMYRKKGRAFCSKTCSQAYRSGISSETMSQTNLRFSSTRMILKNPMRSPETRAKVSATLREIGHSPRVRGGHGSGPTIAESLAFQVLAPQGFVLQHVVRTGWGRGNATHYTIDVAHPVLKIAIELDGSSHQSLARKQSDARKDEFLRGQGWKVFRFSNEIALSSLATITSTISKLTGFTPISPTT